MSQNFLEHMHKQSLSSRYFGGKAENHFARLNSLPMSLYSTDTATLSHANNCYFDLQTLCLNLILSL
jgi:hypothetical protein